MNNLLLGLTVVCSIALNSSQPLAATLSLNPSTPTIGVGDTATVDLVISGLGDFGTPSLGAFLAEVTFDGNILSTNTPSFGVFLGDPSDPLETDIVTTIGPAVVSLDEFSFLSNSELDTLQPESFSLATLSFTGDSLGTSALGFGLIDLSDAIGSTIIGPSIQVATVSVVRGATDGPLPIPLPASFWFLATALFSLFGIGKLKTPSDQTR